MFYSNYHKKTMLVFRQLYKRFLITCHLWKSYDRK